MPLLEYAAGLLACYYIVLSVYRVFFHPLSRIPGPLLAKISDCYAGYFALGRSLHLRTHKDHGRYGSIMRYGPDRLVFNSAQAVHDIYQNPKITKSSVYTLTVVQGATMMFNTISPQLHSHRRKIIGPALSERSIRFFEATLIEQIDVFLRCISHAEKASVNLTDASKRLAMDVAGHLGFGFALHLQTKDDHRFILDGISLANYRINAYMNFPFLSRLQLDRIFKLSPIRAKWRQLIEKMITSRLAQGQDAIRDFYSFVVGNLDAGTNDLQQSELFGESQFFMSAGGDTVSCTIAALFFYLSRYPSCYDQLAREIRTNFASEDELRAGPKLSGCLYLRACIDEALRMSPPIAGTLWRQLASDDGNEPLLIDGLTVPQGTHVGVNTYAIQHSEEYFPDPFIFKPERWMDKPTPDLPARSAAPLAARQAFIPFSVGARSCAGKSLAYLESSLVLAKTLWSFDFEIPSGDVNTIGGGKQGLGDGRSRLYEFQLYDALTSRHDGPYLTFKPRVVSHAKR
ncbi:cytochrome P450 [Xylaria telfairii]|nr:cytochrome P450 [Xylaria telfairii]